MYICEIICIYICMYRSIHVYVFTCICKHVCTCTCRNMHMCLQSFYMCICRCVLVSTHAKLIHITYICFNK